MSKNSCTFATALKKLKAYMVVLAQLAEHRIVVPSVVGSSPTFHPKTAEIPLGVAAVSFYITFIIFILEN